MTEGSERYWEARWRDADKEIERLKAALQLAQRWAAEAADALQPSAEENTRLRAEVERLTDKVANREMLRQMQDAEIERLKAALRQINKGGVPLMTVFGPTTPVCDPYRERIKVLEAALREADLAINPPDRSGISMETWNKRLKAATEMIRAALKEKP